MAIRLNLYHEIQRQEIQRQYDPLKISMLGILVIALGLASYYFVEAGKLASVQGRLNEQQEEFSKLEPQAKAAERDQEEINKEIKLAEVLAKRIEDRFYWAPILEQVATVVPTNVQITKFSGDVGRDATRRCQLSMDGLAAGEEPRKTAEELRMALSERLSKTFKNVTATFRTLDDSAESVQLDGRQLATATFGINVSFTAGVEAPPPPAPVAPRRAR
jgi:Tfp pilus assembly protein PilN